MSAVITAWTAVSPYGTDRESFVDGVAAGPATSVLVPGFGVRELLGKKGTRSMDRVTGLAVLAVGQLTGPAELEPRDGTGLVLSTVGSTQSTMDISRSTFVEAKPYFVDPGQMPNSVMNCAAGRCAIWHQLTGPNVTLASGRTAGLDAVNYAMRLLRNGRARTMLVGGVEEFSPARTMIERHSGNHGRLGEGCVVLRVAATADQPLAEVLAVRSRFATSDDVAATLRACVTDTLRHGGVNAEDVTTVSISGLSDVDEQAALGGLLRSDVLDSPSVAGLIGDTGAASAMFQVAEVLAKAERHGAGGLALVTSVDRECVVACALLRVHGAT
jgi:3-oxoacyl-[acyl-carrier-protein] synthase II